VSEDAVPEIMHDVHYPDSYFGEEMNLPAPAGTAIGKERFVAIKEHLYSDLNGEAVILSLKNGKYYGLNEVGKIIWNSIKEPTNLAQIQARVMSEYEVDENICYSEVLSFLHKMHREELIEILNEKTP
jgi:hypothetical protein